MTLPGLRKRADKQVFSQYQVFFPVNFDECFLGAPVDAMLGDICSGVFLFGWGQDSWGYPKQLILRLFQVYPDSFFAIQDHRDEWKGMTQ